MSTGDLDMRAKGILDLLARSGWKIWDRRVPRNPEQRRSLERLYTATSETTRLEREGTMDADGASRRALFALLDFEPPNSPDALGQLLEEVDQLLIAVGDAQYVCSLLQVEYVRDQTEQSPEIVTWSMLYRTKPIQASVDFAAGQPVSVEAMAEARHKLSALYRARQFHYALARARVGMRAMRLLWLAPVMALLVIALIILVDVVAADLSWRVGLLVALAGALGASLSGAYKLRDQIPRLITLRTFWYAFALQLALGAVAGLFLWIVLLSGFVDLTTPGPEWAVDGAVAFVAGFSEPWVLKTVARIVGDVGG